MKRTILIVLGLFVLGAPVAGAAGPEHLSPVQRIIRQEDRGGHISLGPAPRALDNPVQRIILQEEARKNDPALLGAGSTPTIQFVDSGGFHWGDAGIGAAVLAAAMLVLAGTVIGLRAARPSRA
jgi:hypothetical protein